MQPEPTPQRNGKDFATDLNRLAMKTETAQKIKRLQ